MKEAVVVVMVAAVLFFELLVFQFNSVCVH